MARKPNAYVDVKIVDDRLVLYINPATWKAGIEISRFYLLHEDGCDVDSCAMAPVLGGYEYNAPSNILLDLTPRTKRAKKFFEKLKELKIPRRPRKRKKSRANKLAEVK